MVDGVPKEADCQYDGCQRVAYIEFTFEYDFEHPDGWNEKWFCFRHAKQMFEDWEDHSTLDITAFPDETLFECVGYPSNLAMLVAAWEHGD